MKNAKHLLWGIVAALAFSALGCGNNSGEFADKPTVASPTKQVKAGGKVQAGGVADLNPDPAPPGVQTGTH